MPWSDPENGENGPRERTPRTSQGPADFSDYLIGQVCREYEAAPVFTLDASAAKGQNFEMVPGT